MSSAAFTSSAATAPNSVRGSLKKEGFRGIPKGCLKIAFERNTQSVEQVARSSGNVRQPDHVLANLIAGHKAERRSGAGEEGLAATKYDGMEVQPILIDETKVGQASRQVWSGNFNLPNELSLQPTHRRLEVILDKRGVGAD
jgi:hypothetical protein